MKHNLWASDMSVIDELNVILKATDIFKQVVRSMEDEPLKLLVDICDKNTLTGRPVPDHNLRMPGYIGDVALRALIETGLVEKKDGGRVSLYSYQPTECGIAYYQRLKAEANVKK